MTTKITLYNSFPFRGTRCAWLLQELNIDPSEENSPVKIQKISLHSPPEILAEYKENVHPYGTIPALLIEEDGKEQTILESAAICLYFAQKFDKGLLPSSPEEYPNYFNWIVHASATVDSVLEPLYMQLTHTPEEKRNQELIDKSKAKFEIFCKTFSHFLSHGRIHGSGEERPFVCGNQFTAADCVIGYNIWWASAIDKGALLTDYPVISSYLARLKERPAFQRAFSPR